MAAEGNNVTLQATRLLSCYLPAGENGLNNSSIMLCEVIGDEIQSISLRVAADAMTEWRKPSDA